MSSSVNKVIIIGNLTKDVELKKTQGGQSVCSFSVATNRSWKDAATGEKKEQVEFHSIVAWGKLAEICAQYPRKGSKLYLEGRLQTRKWEKDGVNREKTEIIADNMVMLDRKPSGPDTRDNADMGGIETHDEPEPEEVKVEDIPFG